MKKWPKLKKRIYIILVLLVFTRISYIVICGDLTKKYTVENTIDLSNAWKVPCEDLSQTFALSHNNLNKLGLLLYDIPDDENGYLIVQIKKQDELLYQTKVSYKESQNGVWRTLHVNIPIDPNCEYTLNILKDEDGAASPNTMMTDNGIVVLYGCLDSPTILDKMVVSSIWVFFLIAIYFLFNNSTSIIRFAKQIFEILCKDMPWPFVNVIVEILLCMAVIEGSGIEFQESSKIALYVLSVVCSYNVLNCYKDVATLFNSCWKKSILFFLYLYCAFSLVGQRLLLYPLNKTIKFVEVFVFLLAVLWSIPVINAFIFAVINAHKVFIDDEEKKKSNINFSKKVCYWGIVVALLIFPAIYNLYVNNPGISSVDTRNTLAVAAHGIRGMVDWHPAFYCMVLRAIISIWDSTYAVIFVQYFFWIYVMLEFLIYLRDKGFKKEIILCIAAFLGLNTANYLHLNTIWKDIPFTLSIFWSMVIVSKLMIDKERYKSRWYIYFELMVSLVGVYFYRKNGFVSFIVIAIFVIVSLKNNRKVIFTLVASAILICVIRGPIYNYFEIQDSGHYGMYTGLGQDVLGVYYYGDSISKETVQMVTVMTNYNISEYVYNPTWSNQNMNADIEPLDFIKNYIDCFLREPMVMTRAILNRVDGIWDIYEGKDAIHGGVIYTGTEDYNEIWALYYPKRVYSSLSDRQYLETCYSFDNKLITALEWRAGLFTLIGFASAVALYIKKGIKTNIVLISPILGVILSLLLSMGWSDFRYYWPLNLMNICLFNFAVYICREK